MLVALLALFVALGGPAQADRLLGKGSVTAREVKDRSLSERDLSRRTVTKLRRTPARSIRGLHLTPGAVSSAAIMDRGVGPNDIAPGAIGGAAVADGTLTSRDVARWSGRFSIDIPPVPAGECWSREPVLQTLDAAGADIRGDVVEVTPDGSWPRARTAGREIALTLTTYTSATPSRFVISVCNPTTTPLPAAPTRVAFAYAVIDVP
jgi:hypothetical protein